MTARLLSFLGTPSVRAHVTAFIELSIIIRAFQTLGILLEHVPNTVVKQFEGLLRRTWWG